MLCKFLHKYLYLAMLALLQEVLMFLTSGDKKINRLNLFCALFYTPWFLQSSKPEKAPTNDLMAYKDMPESSSLDNISDAVGPDS